MFDLLSTLSTLPTRSAIGAGIIVFAISDLLSILSTMSPIHAIIGGFIIASVIIALTIVKVFSRVMKTIDKILNL